MKKKKKKFNLQFKIRFWIQEFYNRRSGARVPHERGSTAASGGPAHLLSNMDSFS